MSSRGKHEGSSGSPLHDLKWLDAAPVVPGAELPDEEVPILDEPPIVTEARNLPGGPYLLAPDSAEQMPTDFLAVLGEAGIDDVITRAKNDEANLQARAASAGKAALSSEQSAFLAKGGPAAKQLLETLNRGLEPTTPTLEAASIGRLIKAGLL